MNDEEHLNRHKELHKYYDELVADYIFSEKKILSKTNLMELMIWSYQQKNKPECNSIHLKENNK